MANEYFDFLGSQPEQGKGDSVNLTVRADAECQLVCDGDFLELLKANQIVKLKAPVGQHILQFICIDYPDLCVEKIVDWPDAGKNYLVIVNEFKGLIAGTGTIGKQEEVAPQKTEDSRLQEINKMDFLKRYCYHDDFDGETLKSKWRFDDKEIFCDLVEREIKPAAESGNLSAVMLLAEYYDYVVRDEVEAEKYYLRAAEQGFLPAMHKIGHFYWKDNAKAVKWFRKAAEQGYAPAQKDLGNSYLFGSGVEKNPQEAERWYLKAADQGYGPAMVNLGNCYYFAPEGFERDEFCAAQWWQKAADLGCGAGQVKIASCYAWEYCGFPEDESKSEEWSQKASQTLPYMIDFNAYC